MNVAQELGYTLAKLNQEITLEELYLWGAFFRLQNEEQEKRMKQRR